MRSYWSGTLTIGLLSIPVKLYGAVKSHDSSFKRVHKNCMSPVKQVNRCPECERDVLHTELTRGHEFTKGRFVEVTDTDLDNLPLPSAGTILLDGFAPSGILPDMRREKSVYLGPDKGGGKAYAVLARAMRDQGVSAVGKVAIRDREHLVAIESPDGRALTLTQVYYADEVAPASEIPDLPDTDAASPKEVDMAKQVIGILPLDGALDNYTDGAQEALGKILEAKATGQPLPEVRVRPATAPDDLLTALKKTLEAKRGA